MPENLTIIAISASCIGVLYHDALADLGNGPYNFSSRLLLHTPRHCSLLPSQTMGDLTFPWYIWPFLCLSLTCSGIRSRLSTLRKKATHRAKEPRQRNILQRPHWRFHHPTPQIIAHFHSIPQPSTRDTSAHLGALPSPLTYSGDKTTSQPLWRLEERQRAILGYIRRTDSLRLTRLS